MVAIDREGAREVFRSKAMMIADREKAEVEGEEF
jgi:hypothetical protein